MKLILSFAFFIVVSFASGQDTIYYNSNWLRIHSRDDASYYKVIQHDLSDTNKVKQVTYFKSGQIKYEANYSDFSNKKLNGKSKEWFSTGQLQREIDYQDGKFNGKILTYWDNGKPKRIDMYVSDSLISGKCYDSDGNELPYFPFEIMPQFPGGDDGLFKYIKSEIKYPKKSRKNGIGGRVLVKFIVKTDGSISSARIVEGINPELDAESIRVVENMPSWKPGMQDGETVQVEFNLPIRFKPN